MCVNNTYAIICDHFWDEQDAQIVCRLLSLNSSGHSISVRGSHFGNTTSLENIALDNVRCSGNEIANGECVMTPNPECDLFESAGVICQHPGMYVCQILNFPI